MSVEARGCAARRASVDFTPIRATASAAAPANLNLLCLDLSSTAPPAIMFVVLRENRLCVRERQSGAARSAMRQPAADSYGKLKAPVYHCLAIVGLTVPVRGPRPMAGSLSTSISPVDTGPMARCAWPKGASNGSSLTPLTECYSVPPIVYKAARDRDCDQRGTRTVGRR